MSSDAVEIVKSTADGEETPRHPTRTMAGFDEFADVVDYIEKSTSWIWDRKQPGLIYRFYTPLTVVHTSDGTTFGRDEVIENSIAKMAAFPDIRDHVEDTIWSGNDRDGYLTSMRWTWTARNTGWGSYGPPTNRRVVVEGIANCVVKGENIIEEWVVYNELSLLRQLGLNIRTYLDSLAADGVLATAGAGDVDRLIAQDPPEPMAVHAGREFGVENFVRRHAHEVWNRRMIGDIDLYYAPNAIAHGTSDRELYGAGDVKQDVLATMAMLPDCRKFVDEVYWNRDGADQYRVASRWTIVGTNSGPSRYCVPTGRRVRIMGITHQRIEHGRITEEWTQYGEFSLLKQLLLPQRPTALESD